MMKNMFHQSQGYDDKVTMMGRKSHECENLLGGSSTVSGGKNRCVILPVNVPFIADSLERRNKNWIAKANSAVDLIIEVGNSSFHLHKLAMVSKSEYLNRLVFQRGSNKEISSDTLKIQIKNLPGGANIFELVVKFCYGWKIEITVSNIALLYCAAHFLEMSEDLEEENLIFKTEPFLNFLILSSWKDTFHILKTTEPISTWAKELQIVKRCSEAIAWKACTNNLGLENNVDTFWWFEDVSNLRIDHFIEVIQYIKKRGMESKLVGSCISHWTMKWFLQFMLGLEKLAPKHIALHLHRVSIECLIRILPTEENSVTCNFLLHLLKTGGMLRINSEMLCVLERRIALILEQCIVSDILVKNHGDKGSLYDVGVVLRVLQCYVSHISSNPPIAKLHAVGKLVDGYLIQVARDENLTVESFKSLVDALPQNARLCDDHLYRAIDMFLKAHSYLTEEDRTYLCRVLEYHRLSREARQHVMKNDRLPLKLTTQFVLLEQVNMASSMTSTNGSNYRRGSTKTMIRVSKDFEKRQIINANEMKIMKKDVEVIKSQLLELNTCKVKLQKQMKRGCI